MPDSRDNIPTIVVTDKEGYLVNVGKADCSDKHTIWNFIKVGYTIKTVTYKEFIEMNLTWVYDKK